MSTIKVVQSDQEIAGVKQVELYLDGDFECSWNTFHTELNSSDLAKIQNMVNRGIKHGEDKMREKIRDLLGCK